MPYNSLRPIRERKGLTIAQLAGKTSLSIRTLQSYEAGERAIAPDDLRKLSRVLLATPAEILQPSAPPPPPVAPPPPPPQPVPAAAPAAPRVEPSAATVAPPPSSTLAAAAPDEAPPRRPFIPYSRERPQPGTDGAASARPTRPVRPPREPRPPRPPGPSTAGQIEQIRHLARRMGLNDAELVERASAPLETLDHSGARAAIARLRQELEESGTWQPRVGEGPDQEG